MNKIIISTVLFLVSSATFASLSDEINSYCGKVKTCTVEQFQSQGIPEDIRAQMLSSVESSCKQDSVSSFNAMSGEVEQSARACLVSMAEASCEDIVNGTFASNACAVFEKTVADLN